MLLCDSLHAVGAVGPVMCVRQEAG
jgi:hypothetical protein